MEILSLIIAIVALIIAIIAFQRTGGTKDLKKSTAELLAKVEKKMREEAPDIEEEKTQQ
jgi:type III secretory pathway component EscU